MKDFIKKICILAAFFACMSCASTNSTKTEDIIQKAPVWYLNKEAEYPTALYIAAIGEGRTRFEAEQAALSNVSLYFNTKTEVRNEMLKNYNTYFETEISISESTQVKSDAEFLAVQFTDVWYDPNQGKYFSLAYIDRSEALRIYDAKIQYNIEQTKSLLKDASAETDLLTQQRYLKKAQVLIPITNEYIQAANTVQSQNAARYADVASLHSLVDSFYAKVHNAISFKIISPNDREGRIKRVVFDILEAKGYKGTVDNAPYTVLIQISTAEEEMPSGKFVRAGINLTVVNNEGRVFASHNKNYGRNGGVTWDGAYNRAFFEMEKDLKENLIKEFL